MSEGSLVDVVREVSVEEGYLGQDVLVPQENGDAIFG